MMCFVQFYLEPKGDVLLMTQVGENDKPENRVIKIVFNMIYIVLILGAIHFFFDNNSLNNSLGALALLTFWIFRGIHQMLLSLWGNNRKSLLFDLLLVITALACLIYVVYHL